ncbi:hypothetical protein NKR23_g9277 [Pleurostoma richardsiae]|uniref:Uncharacterized protein n=1 Tax=Pleurostoma richardsiae TaxID=41990 RepID=A0AA38R4W3_9PEZI|nr:hypothetical protein NKR23_g9277 [Pleurostoma richardsiae]
MPSQRPFFLSSFIAALRQQPPNLPASTAQPNKHTGQAAASSSAAAASSSSPSSSSSPGSAPPGSVVNQVAALHPPSHRATAAAQTSTTGGVPIPGAGCGRRRGSDSSSEGFRDVLGADKWYIGGRTAAGEEKFFKLGVVRRVRSGDRLSLDRLSL